MSRLKKFILVIVLLLIFGIGIIFFKGVKSFSVISTGEALFSPTDKRWDILILGNRGDTAKGGGILTDSIIVLSYKRETGEVALFSIPRDLWVDIPEYGKQRINFAYSAGQARNPPNGGLDLAKEVVGNVIGLDIDLVVVVDIKAVREIVDILGGIEIYEDSYFSLRFYSNYVTIHPGVNYLSGSEVLAYVGSRAIGSDFGRMERQQKVLVATKEKVFSLGLLARPDKIWSILNTLEDHIRTDVPLSQFKDVTDLVSKLEINNIKQVVFETSNYLYSTHTETGAYILLPKAGDFSEIQDVCQNIFEPQEEKIDGGQSIDSD